MKVTMEMNQVLTEQGDLHDILDFIYFVTENV